MPRSSAAERKLCAATDSYIKNCAATGASPRTVEAYTATLENFVNFFIESKENYADPSYATILLWRDYLIDSGCSTYTVALYVNRLRTFFDYASDPECGGWYANNPVSRRLTPDTRKTARRPYDVLLTDQQVMKLWRNDKPATAKAKTWPRNYAIVIMLLTTELRNAELLDLTPADLHWEDGELSVESGKGSKFRRIEFPDIAQSAVRIYLASGIRPKDLPDTAPLFGNTAPKGTFGPRTGDESREWQRGSRQWLSTLVESHVRAVTGVPDIRSHDLRHVGARIDLNAGMKQEELQSKLGHTNPNVTQRYSGRLLSRTGKRSAALVLEARERQADINANILAGRVQNA